MQHHPARRAHILAFVGAALLIITVGSTALKLGNQLIHYENVNHESASAAGYMYRLQDSVGELRACYYEYNATHAEKSSRCYSEAASTLLNDFSNFSSYRSIEVREDNVRPDLMELVQLDLEKILSWPHSVKAVPAQGGQIIDQLDRAFSELYHATSRDYTIRLVDIVRASIWERMLGILGGIIGVISLISAGWVLDRALLGFRKAESDARHLTRRFRAVLENLTIGVALFGSDGRLWHWNKPFEKLLGLKKGTLKAGLSYNALCVMMVSDGLPLPEPFETVERRLSRAERMAPDIVEYKSRRGYEMELGRNLFFDMEDPAQRGGLLMTLSDITMRLRSERAIGEGKKLRAIGQLTAGIAHDFKNFLTIILGNIELAQHVAGEGAAAKREKYLRVAANAVQHSENLTRQLLTFTRRKNAVKDVVDPRQLFSFLSELLERVMGRAVTLKFHVSDDVWCIRGDGAQLECVIINLAINGRDAMSCGGVLNITARNFEFKHPTPIKNFPVEGGRNRRVLSSEKPVPPGRWVRVDVIDTGLGMSQDVMDRLFVPFFTTKQEGRGTGLGMAMVISCLKDVGGYLMVESGVGVGTCVSLWLPAIACETDKKSKEGSATSPKTCQLDQKKQQPVRGHGPHSETVLVVEDDPGIGHIVVSILTTAGYDVVCVHTAPEAISVLTKKSDVINLLITDIELPGTVDGIAISYKARAILPHIPVIYMSGNIQAAQEKGVEGSLKLKKPFGRATLVKMVNTLLGGEKT